MFELLCFNKDILCVSPEPSCRFWICVPVEAGERMGREPKKLYALAPVAGRNVLSIPFCRVISLCQTCSHGSSQVEHSYPKLVMQCLRVQILAIWFIPISSMYDLDDLCRHLLVCSCLCACLCVYARLCARLCACLCVCSVQCGFWVWPVYVCMIVCASLCVGVFAVFCALCDMCHMSHAHITSVVCL